MPNDATAAAPAEAPPASVPLSAPEGLRSATVTVTTAEVLHVEALRRELWGRWEPADPVEVDQVEALLMVRLKEARLDRLELEVLDARGPDRAALPSLATLGRYRRQLDQQRRAIEADLCAFRDALEDQEDTAEPRLPHEAEPPMDHGRINGHAERFARTNEPDVPVSARGEFAAAPPSARAA